MSYLNRVWVATTVAVAQGHTDPGHKCKTAFGSICQNRTRPFSADSLSDLRPLAGVDVSDVPVSSEAEERLRQTDDSLRKVMYMNCWGQA
ncbi:unnamed protein product [Lathyrus sativus]|nr:unnamed protein product [Lathyrus sativus]